MLLARQNDELLTTARPPLAFLDIDNTLSARVSATASDDNFLGTCAMPTERVYRAIEAAAAKGTMVFLCTGRPMPGIHPDLLELPVAGVVSCAGAQATYGEEQLRDVRLSPSDLHVICDSVVAAGGWCLIEGPDMIACVGDDPLADNIVRPYHSVDALAQADPTLHFGKVVVNDFGSKIVEKNERVAKRFTVFNTGGGVTEITLPEISKSAGIAAVLARIGEGHGTTYGFGDSDNDSALFDAVDVKVAMGNSTPAIKQRADYVTDPVTEDGAATGLEHFGLA